MGWAGDNLYVSWFWLFAFGGPFARNSGTLARHCATVLSGKNPEKKSTREGLLLVIVVETSKNCSNVTKNLLREKGFVLSHI